MRTAPAAFEVQFGAVRGDQVTINEGQRVGEFGEGDLGRVPGTPQLLLAAGEDHVLELLLVPAVSGQVHCHHEQRRRLRQRLAEAGEGGVRLGEEDPGCGGLGEQGEQRQEVGLPGAGETVQVEG